MTSAPSWLVGTDVGTPRELHVVRRRGACCHFLEIKLCPIVHSLSVHRLERFEVLVRQRLTQHVSKRVWRVARLGSPPRARPVPISRMSRVGRAGWFLSEGMMAAVRSPSWSSSPPKLLEVSYFSHRGPPRVYCYRLRTRRVGLVRMLARVKRLNSHILWVYWPLTATIYRTLCRSIARTPILGLHELGAAPLWLTSPRGGSRTLFCAGHNLRCSFLGQCPQKQSIEKAPVLGSSVRLSRESH